MRPTLLRGLLLTASMVPVSAADAPSESPGAALLREAADHLLTVSQVHLVYRNASQEVSVPTTRVQLHALRQELWLVGDDFALTESEFPAAPDAQTPARKSRTATDWAIVRRGRRTEQWRPWDGRLLIRWLPSGVADTASAARAAGIPPLHIEPDIPVALDPLLGVALDDAEGSADGAQLNLAAWRNPASRAALLAPFSAAHGPWTWTPLADGAWQASRRIGRTAIRRDYTVLDRAKGQPIYEFRLVVGRPADGPPRILRSEMLPDDPQVWGVRTEFTYRETTPGQLVMATETETAVPENIVTGKSELLECDITTPLPAPGTLIDPLRAKEVLDETAKMAIDPLSP